MMENVVPGLFRTQPQEVGGLSGEVAGSANMFRIIDDPQRVPRVIGGEKLANSAGKKPPVPTASPSSDYVTKHVLIHCEYTIS